VENDPVIRQYRASTAPAAHGPPERLARVAVIVLQEAAAGCDRRLRRFRGTISSRKIGGNA